MHDFEEEEFREKQKETIAEFLERISAFEYFRNLQRDPNFREKVAFDDFLQFITRINGVEGYAYS